LVQVAPRAVIAEAQASAETPGAGRLAPFVVALFFAWGFATVLIDTLIPKLKGLFALNYAEAMLTQFAFFIAYLLISAPAAAFLARVGYLRTIVVGLTVMAAGCLLFAPAAAAGVYWGFLAALFIMACGITTLQVAANPLIAVLGSSARSHSRLNLAQAFNSLGTFIGPFVGAALILQGGVAAPDTAKMGAETLAAYRQAEAHAVQAPFLGIAVLLVVLAAVFWFLRRSPAAPSATRTEANLSALALLRQRPRLAFGVLSIFLYVGAEVAIGSLMINYLMEPRTLALSAAAAGQLVAFYWGGAMVGRMIGSGVMLRVPAGRVLMACALGAAALVALSGASTGYLAAGAIVAVGLCNSVMFPTIFSLAIEELGPDTPQGSGLLCMAIVGGAIVPLITGALADRVGLALALLAPAACYLWIAAYGLLAHAGRLDRSAVHA